MGSTLDLVSYGPVFKAPHPDWTIEILSPERPPVLETTTYIRKPFHIDAVQVTAENMDEVAKWVSGDVRTESDNVKYVKVRVHRPLNDRQTKAYITDWVLYAGTGYKVYTDKAFRNSFEQVSGETKMVDTTAARSKGKNAENDIVAVVEGDVVVPKRVAKKTAKSA